MIRRQFAALLLLFALLVPYVAFAQQPQGSPQAATDPNDPVARIRDEGMNRSQVMQTLSYLSDVIGPRLTASPNMKRANEWTRDTMTKWGLQNAHLEAWGPFGRGWSLKRFSAQVIEPQGIPVIAYPKAWSPGIEVMPEVSATAPAGKKKSAGPAAATQPSSVLTADVVYFDAKDENDLARFKGQLKGKIVFTAAMREVRAHFETQGTRRDEKNLLALANAPMPRPGGGRGGFGGNRNAEFIAAQQFIAKKNQFLADEGAGVLVDSARGDGGTIFVQSATVPQPFSPNAFGPNAPRRISPYDKDAPKIVPQISMAAEHYNRIVRMIQAGEKVKMQVDLAVEWQNQDLNGYNTIAEIPGSDPQLKDEIVMLGGHMDSWHSGTGATDNGAGVAVGMEAVRIIQALGLKPRRTIRIALWSGEEQGLLGSRAYVAQHFGKFETPTAAAITPAAGDGTAAAAPAPVLVKMPEYEKLTGYFNLDNGTGKIRGVYLQGNDAVGPIFRQWLTAFQDRPNENVWQAQTLSLANTGGTDHLAFDAIGLPGFQFIQDEIEYDTRTHHSNMDVFDRIQGDDMKQAATIMAAFVYNTAMRDEKLPRKPVAGR